MAEKVTELSWAAFAKADLTKDQRKLVEDAGFVKALAALDKTDERQPADRLKALEAVIEQIPKLVVACGRRKKELGKAFDDVKDKLHGLLESAEAQQKAMKKALEAAKDKSDDEEEESPALLTTKLIPLLREVRKGDLVLQALVALAGKETVVLLSRRAISPARGKLLKDQMSSPNGLKFVRGECLWENNSLTFVVQAPAAALAKRIRTALLVQTDLRLRVKVRGEDGVEELDGEEDSPGQEDVQKQKASPGGPASAEQLAYTQRLLKIRDRYEQALSQQHPEATKLRALMGLASEKADEQNDYSGAIQALQALEKVLDASTSAPGGGAGPDAAFKARLTALIPRLKEAQTAGGPAAREANLKASEAGTFARKKEFEQANSKLDEIEKLLGVETKSTERGKSAAEALMAWQEARATSIEQLRRLSTVVASTRDPQVKDFIVLIQAIIKNLTASPTELRSIVEVERYLQTDDIIAEVETPNPFGVTINVRAPLLHALDVLRSSLAA